ncbi:WSC domain-containing protein 2 isoform X3 [Myotis myotis]|uniref:WSC domain-containing protein 2 isoform X3 n=1 Tax=Myotis myotis TaxID=51298 RepID=UPI00174D6046|nr:WSC domain-containing protein 2 isoform X3 [Myotis myotis]
MKRLAEQMSAGTLLFCLDTDSHGPFPIVTKEPRNGLPSWLDYTFHSSWLNVSARAALLQGQRPAVIREHQGFIGCCKKCHWPGRFLQDLCCKVHRNNEEYLYMSVPWRLSMVLTILEVCLVSMSAGQPLPGLSPFPSHFAFSVGKYYEAYMITEQNRSLTSWFTVHVVDFVCHYGSAVFRGCFRRPHNLSLALPVTAAMPNMSVDKCVDLCTEKEYPLAALAGTSCHCGFPTTRFPLHEREDEQLCAQKCSAEEFESCGTPSYFIVYQTQVQDNRCMDRRFLPAKSKQLIALASFPGAGNTWARHLIELATGFYTGSYYFDGSLYNKGFKGERDHWRSGRTICIKTHESGQKEIEAFDAAILLIRNPYKALMAEFNRKYGGHIGFAAHAHWKGKEWPEFVRNYAPWWATHTLDWLKFGKKVLVVHFEDLKQDLFVQLGRMVRLLGVAVREDRLLCVESQKDGNFKRSGLRKLEYDPYTADMRRTIQAYIKLVDAALKGRNLTGVPDDYYPR